MQLDRLVVKAIREYENEEARRKIHTIDFGKNSRRDPEMMRKLGPNAVDARFDNLSINLDKVKGHRNSSSTVLIGKVSNRTPLFESKEPQPAYDTSRYKTIGIKGTLHKFENQDGHKSFVDHLNKEVRPAGYDSENLKKGFEATTNLYKTKVLTNISK